MKTSCFAVLAACACLPAAALAEVDFSLQHQMRNADAISSSQSYVTDGATKIYLDFPGNWRALDSAQKLELLPAVANSKVSFENHHGAELTIDETGGRQLLQQVVAQLSKEATNVAAYPLQINPFPILGWTDLQVTIRYDLAGQTWRRSTMYVNMQSGRLVEFTVLALDSDFDKLYKPARAVLASFFATTSDPVVEFANKSEADSGR